MSRGDLIRTIWEQHRSLTIIVCLLLLINLAIFLAQSQLFDQRLMDKRDAVRQQQNGLRVLQQQKQSGSMPVSDLEKVEKDLTRIQQMIPFEDQLSGLIGELFSTANDAGLSIKQVSYKPEMDKELELLRYDLQFSVSGQYGQLKHFIHQLEKAQRILVISDISLSGGEGRKGKTADVALKITLKTFFRGRDAA
ncbi:MAG: hypothetical protein C0618_01545 [Desulfuromonas sp.]|nr:MAG: hypothetical protein C0618_01545 [Desulfuromonas sp.]